MRLEIGHRLAAALTESGIVGMRCAGTHSFMNVAWKRAFDSGQHVAVPRTAELCARRIGDRDDVDLTAAGFCRPLSSAGASTRCRDISARSLFDPRLSVSPDRPDAADAANPPEMRPWGADLLGHKDGCQCAVSVAEGPVRSEPVSGGGFPC